LERKTIDGVLQETYSAKPAERKAAVRELCPCELKIDNNDVWFRILELTRDPDAGVRRGALYSLIDGSPRAREEEVVRALEGMRNDSDPKLRRHARRLLDRYRRTGRVNIDGH
jgi:HEAT repeat protein